jgi:hypothetical protein
VNIVIALSFLEFIVLQVILMIHNEKVTRFRLIGFLAINRMSNHWRMAINIAITLFAFSTIWESSTYAQISPDNSLKDANSIVEMDSKLNEREKDASSYDSLKTQLTTVRVGVCRPCRTNPGQYTCPC